MLYFLVGLVGGAAVGTATTLYVVGKATARRRGGLVRLVD